MLAESDICLPSLARPRPGLKNLDGVSSIHAGLQQQDLGLFILQKSLIPSANHIEPIPLGRSSGLNLPGILALVPQMVRALDKNIVTSLIPLHSSKTSSPLCLAAAYGLTKSLVCLVEIGDDVEFEGHSAGTALMVAAATGELDIVKILVRRGARISYTSPSSHFVRSAVTYSEPYPEIRRWLLVEQFTDQKKIEFNNAAESQPDTAEMRPWAGVGKAEVPLVGHRAQQPLESLKSYLVRLNRIKTSYRGLVVPYHSWK